MPTIPEPVGSPEQLVFLRWVRDTLNSITKDTARQLATDSNTNASQNSTMNMLVQRLGAVQESINGMIALATFSGNQITSGTVAAAYLADIDASKVVSGTLTRPVNASGDVTASGHGTFNAAWNYDVSAVTRRAVWMDAAGRMGQTVSSERFKKDIETWSPEEQAILALRLVRFHWKPEIGDDDHWEYGVIAEELDALGLTWLVSYEEDGVTPHSVHYDRLALALMPLIQSSATKVQDLEQQLLDTTDRLEAIEARLAALETY